MVRIIRLSSKSISIFLILLLIHSNPMFRSDPTRASPIQTTLNAKKPHFWPHPNHLQPPPNSWQFRLQNLKQVRSERSLGFGPPSSPHHLPGPRKAFKVSMFVWQGASFHSFIPTTKVVVDIPPNLKHSNNEALRRGQLERTRSFTQFSFIPNFHFTKQLTYNTSNYNMGSKL